MLSWLLFTTLALADEKAAEDCLRTKISDGYADGWGVRTLTKATLKAGARQTYAMTLYQGKSYQIRTCGDDGVADLDVILYDAAGQVVTHDATADRQPSIAYTPTATGSFYVVVVAKTLAAGRTDGAVAVAVTYR